MKLTVAFSVAVLAGAIVCARSGAQNAPAAGAPAPAASTAAPETAPGLSGRPMMSREQRRELILRPYLEALPDLNEEQQDRIFELVAASMPRIRSIRDDTLTDAQKSAAEQKIRDELQEDVLAVLTGPQQKLWKAALEEQRAMLEATVGHLGALHGGESREEKRSRLTAGYESILRELPIRKRSAILEALGAADDAVSAATTDSEIAAANKAVLDKILPLLNEDQRKRWKNVVAARKTLKKTPENSKTGGTAAPK